nr:MAG TPA: hypothetical protein [Caudoviricetes sp.]
MSERFNDHPRRRSRVKPPEMEATRPTILSRGF